MLAEAIVKAITALDKAEKQFTSYAEYHHAKGAAEKAATNYGYALMCGDALEHLKLLPVLTLEKAQVHAD